MFFLFFTASGSCLMNVQFHGGAEFCACRARVVIQFLFVRRDRLSREDFDCLFFATCTDRHFGRTDACGGFILEELFDDSVFKRMECDDGENAVRGKKLQSVFQRVGEFI